MRQRINSFGYIKYKDINKYLTENSVYGLTARFEDQYIVYSYVIMYRHNKKDPEELYVKVSQNSKLVVSACTNWGRKFNNVDELKNYTKR